MTTALQTNDVIVIVKETSVTYWAVLLTYIQGHDIQCIWSTKNVYGHKFWLHLNDNNITVCLTVTHVGVTSDFFSVSGLGGVDLGCVLLNVPPCCLHPHSPINHKSPGVCVCTEAQTPWGGSLALVSASRPSSVCVCVCVLWLSVCISLSLSHSLCLLSLPLSISFSLSLMCTDAKWVFE